MQNFVGQFLGEKLLVIFRLAYLPRTHCASFQITQGGLSLPTRDYYLKNDNSSNAVVRAFRDMIVLVR